VVGAVDVANGDLVLVDADTADGAVVEQEPVPHIQISGAEWDIEHDTHQVNEECTVADESHAVLRLAFPVTVAGKQFDPDALGTNVGLLLGFNGMLSPPATFIERFRELQLWIVGLKIGAGFAGQALIFDLAFTSVDAARFMDVRPRGERDFGQSAHDGHGCLHGTFHEAGVDVGDLETMMVVRVPAVVRVVSLVLAKEFSQDICLLLADVGQNGVVTFNIIRVSPARIVDGLSVTDVIKLHVCAFVM